MGHLGIFHTFKRWEIRLLVLEGDRNLELVCFIGSPAKWKSPYLFFLPRPLSKSRSWFTCLDHRYQFGAALIIQLSYCSYCLDNNLVRQPGSNQVFYMSGIKNCNAIFFFVSWWEKYLSWDFGNLFTY